jgi:hypothetical protein
MSHTIRYPAAEIGQLIIEALAADAHVRGGDSPLIEITYEGRELSANEAFSAEDGTLRFHGDLATQVVLPRGIALTVKEARGDVRVQNVAGDVSLEEIHGELRLQDLTGVLRLGQVDEDIRANRVADFRLTGACDGDLRVEGCGGLACEMVAGDVRVHDAGDVRLNRVRGDLWLDKIRGALQIGRVDGDARVSEVRGPASLHGISGDLRATALLGGLSAQQVNGDVALSGPFTAQDGYQLSAEGDVAVTLPAEADVRLTVRAGGRIRSDMPLTPAADGSANYTAVLGRGATRVSLSGNGDLRVAQPAVARQAGGRSGPPIDIGGETEGLADLRNLGDRIRQQVTASLAAAGIMSPGQEPPARRPAGRTGPAERPRPAGPAPASTEEQTAVLKMLQEGKLSPEEADLLLRALGS